MLISLNINKMKYPLHLPYPFSFSVSKASDCGNGRYRLPLFPVIKRTNNIVYATKPQSNGVPIQLKYDVYEPQGDTSHSRAVMLLIHGGAYLKLLDQNSPDIVLMCNYFAKLGYVTISIDYRQEPNLFRFAFRRSNGESCFARTDRH